MVRCRLPGPVSLGLLVVAAPYELLAPLVYSALDRSEARASCPCWTLDREQRPRSRARYPVSTTSRGFAFFRLDIFVPATEGWHETVTPLNGRTGHEKNFLRGMCSVPGTEDGPRRQLVPAGPGGRGLSGA